jgi:hypothetical protein
MLAIAALLLAGLLATSAAAAGGFLYVLGWVFDLVFVTLPGWLARLWRGG